VTYVFFRELFLPRTEVTIGFWRIAFHPCSSRSSDANWPTGVPVLTEPREMRA